MSVAHCILVGLLLLAQAPKEPASNNAGQIVGKWEASFPNVNGAKMTMDFTKDGKLTLEIIAPNVKKTVTGKYKLLAGDDVQIYDLSEEFGGRKQDKEKVVIKKDQMTLTDSDGQSLAFKRVEPKK